MCISLELKISSVTFVVVSQSLIGYYIWCILVVRARVYVDQGIDMIPYDNENLDFSLSPGIWYLFRVLEFNFYRYYKFIRPDFTGRICASEVVSEFGGHPGSKLGSRQAKEDSHSLDSHPHSHRDHHHHPSNEEAHKSEVGSNTKDLDVAADLAYQRHVGRERTSVLKRLL